MTPEYINHVGAYFVTVNQIISRGAKGKSAPAHYIEFKDTKGRITAKRLNNPMNTYDHGDLVAFLKIMGEPVAKDVLAKIPEERIIAKLKTFIGRNLVVYTEGKEWQGKTMFGVKGFAEEKWGTYLEDNTPSARASYDSTPATETEDLPF